MTATTTDRDLDAAYSTCRAVHRRHGTTYFWAAHVLPARQRRHVHALYAYCRLADEIVDEPGDASPATRRAALTTFSDRTMQALHATDGDDRATGSDREEDAVLAAFAVTVAQLGIPDEAIRRFLGSMAMDLDVASYPRWHDLLCYMDGSAAVIGEMMLPVLEPLDHAAAFQPARDLGLAFQLTNFLRDIGEDLERVACTSPKRTWPASVPTRGPVPSHPSGVELMRFEIARARALYASADQGLPWLPPRSAACVRTARILYSRILVEIEGNDYDVFSTRARVSTGRKLATAARCLGGTIGTRRP